MFRLFQLSESDSWTDDEESDEQGISFDYGASFLETCCPTLLIDKNQVTCSYSSALPPLPPPAYKMSIGPNISHPPQPIYASTPVRPPNYPTAARITCDSVPREDSGDHEHYCRQSVPVVPKLKFEMNFSQDKLEASSVVSHPEDNHSKEESVEVQPENCQRRDNVIIPQSHQLMKNNARKRSASAIQICPMEPRGAPPRKQASVIEEPESDCTLETLISSYTSRCQPVWNRAQYEKKENNKTDEYSEKSNRVMADSCLASIVILNSATITYDESYTAGTQVNESSKSSAHLYSCSSQDSSSSAGALAGPDIP